MNRREGRSTGGRRTNMSEGPEAAESPSPPPPHSPPRPAYNWTFLHQPLPGVQSHSKRPCQEEVEVPLLQLKASDHRDQYSFICSHSWGQNHGNSGFLVSHVVV